MTKVGRTGRWKWAALRCAMAALLLGCGSRSELSEAGRNAPLSNDDAQEPTPEEPIVCGSLPSDCGEASCPTIVDIAAGGEHVCARLSDGTVRCWGSNYVGQLGTGSSGVTWKAPREVPAAVDSVELALGASRSCARFGDGTVLCFGAMSPMITEVGLPEVSQLALGGRHACALSSSGKVHCWGDNGRGQLGNGGTKKRERPVLVGNLPKVTKIALGDEHSCALLANRTVSCWGSNEGGQVGSGTAGPGERQPYATPVPWLSEVVDISLGGAHSCALLDDGSAHCWGSNEDGELGDSSYDQPESPTPVHGLSNITQIAAGRSHTCARLGDGRLSCWGRNTSSQLGDPARPDEDPLPKIVSGLIDVRKVALGNDFTCALLEDASVCCWGDNRYGQIGDGTSTGKPGDVTTKPTAVVWE